MTGCVRKVGTWLSRAMDVSIRWSVTSMFTLTARKGAVIVGRSQAKRGIGAALQQPMEVRMAERRKDFIEGLEFVWKGDDLKGTVFCVGLPWQMAGGAEQGWPCLKVPCLRPCRLDQCDRPALELWSDLGACSSPPDEWSWQAGTTSRFVSAEAVFVSLY